jgi:hypothetical protein
MKITHCTSYTFAFLLFVSSCNNTKAADEKSWKIAVVAVDSVKKKSNHNIDTVDYNKRMLVLSNNDNGRWPV